MSKIKLVYNAFFVISMCTENVSFGMVKQKKQNFIGKNSILTAKNFDDIRKDFNDGFSI